MDRVGVTTIKIDINEIVVGERRREDMGDVKGLADSIAKYGLLHPIVLDGRNQLVAGGRRLEACRLLEWKEINFTSIGELSEKKLREIELEENLKRKDLTEIEKSRNMVELAEIKKEQYKAMSPGDIVSGNRGPTKQNDSMITSAKELNVSALSSPEVKQQMNHEEGEGFYARRKNPGGRPSKDGIPESKVAEEIGIPLTTLREAKQHVQAVERYPVLEEVPKKEAIRTAKQLDSIPSNERQTVIEAIKKTVENEPVASNKPDKFQKTEDEERDKQLARAQRFKTEVDRLIDRLDSLSKHPANAYFDGLDEIEWALNSVSVFADNRLAMIDAAIEWLNGFRKEYAKRIVNKPQGIRRVK